VNQAFIFSLNFTVYVKWFLWYSVTEFSGSNIMELHGQSPRSSAQADKVKLPASAYPAGAGWGTFRSQRWPI